MNVLFLCTGNICRSPMAEVLMVRDGARRGAAVVVSSAGFATEDRPAEPNAVTVMADRGLDLGRHRSRLLEPELSAEADLVVGMAREHVRRACLADRGVLHRTFTLKELVRRGRAVGPVSGGLEDWLDRVNEDRDAIELMGQDPGDDIADPMGRPLRRFRACADEIEAQTAALGDLVWPRGGP